MTIKLVIFDFDGVFTDGKFMFCQNGNSSKSYNCKDAYALKMLKENNILSCIISHDTVVNLENAKHIYNRLNKISTGEIINKTIILDRFLSEFKLELGLDINYNEIAFMGDDLNDYDLLKIVGLSGCPNDAISKIKDICSFKSLYDGGRGAVREFVEHIIELNNEVKVDPEIKGNGKITAVIPVRSGSTRCKNKNIRDFGDTNLLKRKIEILKQVEGIDEILVSSNCDEMLKIASDLGVSIHKRDEYYSSSECPNHEYWTYLANNVGIYENLMIVNCVSPLVDKEIIEDIMRIYNNNKFKNDGITTVNEYQKFFWYSDIMKTVNYDINKTPNSQNLRKLSEITYAVSITSRNNIIKNNSIYGINPFFYKLNNITSIDIDHPHEFVISELLYNNNIESDKDASNLLKRRDNQTKLEMLDCTIRDGGYLNNWNFTDEEVLKCYKTVSECGYDYFEIGFRSNQPGKGKWYYSSDFDIINIKSQYNGCKIAIMCIVGNITINDFIDKKDSNVDLIRILMNKKTIVSSNLFYNEDQLIDSLDLINGLINKGYEVCFNIAYADIISDIEIDLICKSVSHIKLKALYLADTYGGFNEKNIPIVTNKFHKALNKYNPDNNIVLGFHIHNNCQDALSKYKTAKYQGFGMIDSSICGLGRGAGNLITEDVVLNNMNYHSKDTIWNLLECGYEMTIHSEILSKDKYMAKQFYIIAGILSLHPDYIKELLNSQLHDKERFDMIFKLDLYTKENNCRGYDKLLISKI
jgi:YrbI family 3-deoxy-D-manno-octulosonate 8-phosphate phosphatase